MALASLTALPFALFLGIDFIPEALAKGRVESPLVIIGIQVFVERNTHPVLYWVYIGFLGFGFLVGLIAIIFVWRDIISGYSRVLSQPKESTKGDLS